MFRKKLAVALGTAMLGLTTTLALGVTTSSSATGDNAVVHWSGIAEAAISAGATPTTLRPPATSSVLAGMVHGAMYDAVAAVEGGLEPFAIDVPAPPEASADAAVAQAARDVLVARVPGQATTVQAAYDAYMAAIPAGAAKDGGKAVGAAAAAGMLALRSGDHLDDLVPYVQPTPGAGVFEPIAAGSFNPIPPPKPVSVELPLVRPFTYDTPAYRPGPPYALTSKRYADDVAELQLLGGATSTARTPEQTATVTFHAAPTYVQFSRGLRALTTEPSARPAAVRTVARVHVGSGRRHHDRLLGSQVPLHVLASQPRDPASRHRWQRGDHGRSDLAAARHRQPPGVPVRARLLHRGGDEVAARVLRHQASGAHAHHAVPASRGRIRTSTTSSTEVNDARVWGGLHYRWTMTETAKHFPRIAREVYKDHFRAVRGNGR